MLKGNITYASIQSKILVNIGNQIITSYELKNRVKTILVLNNKELNQENVNKTKNFNPSSTKATERKDSLIATFVPKFFEKKLIKK